ncbi:MAG: hypothetical protein J6V58_02160 [Clostridia bacterium]|nr:hypothetical protein [Clostridia bacterium]
MNIFENAEMQKYFETLPAFIQENIVHSGVKPNNLEQLKSCAEKFQKTE